MEILLSTLVPDCPSKYALGDWSDGSGKCCCDPYNQPDGGDAGFIPITLTTDGFVPISLSTGETPTPSSTGETPILMSTGVTPTPSSTGETPIQLSTGSTSTPSGLQPYLLSTKEPTGLTPYLLSSVGSTKVPMSTTTATPTDPPPTLPPVPDYEPSSKPKPLKFCKCRAGVSTTPAPTTTPGLIPYLLTTKKPGTIPFLLTSTLSTTRRPHFMSTSSSFGFTGMTSGSPSRYFRRRGHLLKMFL